MDRTGRGGGCSAKAGRGHGRKKSEVTGLPSRSGEVGACVELGNNIFTLGVNSKSKDGDKLRKTSKAVAMYIGRHFGFGAIVDEIILNVVVTTRSVVGTIDGHLIINFQEWKDKKLQDGILKVASNLMTILRSEGWAVGND